MNDINILIVEDEPVILEHIAECIKQFGYHVMAKCYSIQEAIDACRLLAPDIALLDINLGGKLDGIDLAHHFNKEHDFPIIFTTSYSSETYINRAKKAKPSAYLIKPFDEKSLHAAISLAIHNFEKGTQLYAKDDSDNQNYSINNSFFIKDRGRFVKIHHHAVLWIEANDTYSFVCTSSKRYLVNQSLKLMNEKLALKQFQRIHRSYIVNLNHISAVNKNSVELGGKEIPVGKSYRDELLSRLDLL